MSFLEGQVQARLSLLELIAGLNTPDSGEIWLDGENITNKKLQKRKV